MLDVVPEQVQPARSSLRTTVLSTLVVLAALALAVWKLLPRLSSPTLFAEDGTIFYAQSVEDGAGALLTPYAGYLHLLPRLLIAALTPLGLDDLPLALVIAALVVQLVIAALVLSPRLDWLLPTPLARAAAFLAITALPPVWEVSGNVANAIFVGALSFLLLGLSRDPRTWRGRSVDVALLLVLGLSGPVVVFFVPIFVIRFWRLRTRWSLLSAAIVAAAAAVQIAVYLSSDRETPGGASASTYQQVALLRVGGAWLFGERSLPPGGTPTWALVGLGVWAVLALVAVLMWRPLLGAGLALLAALLISAAVHAYGPSLLLDAHTNQRHLFLPTAILALILVSAAWTARRRLPRVLAVVCLLAGLSGIVHAGQSEAWGPVANPVAVQRFEACVAADRPTCSMPITPDGWTLTINGDRS